MVHAAAAVAVVWISNAMRWVPQAAKVRLRGARAIGAHQRSIMAWMGVTYCVPGASAAIAAHSGRITWRA